MIWAIMTNQRSHFRLAVAFGLAVCLLVVGLLAAAHWHQGAGDCRDDCVLVHFHKTPVAETEVPIVVPQGQDGFEIVPTAPARELRAPRLVSSPRGPPSLA
jgi:hypothetical protein